MEQRRKNNSNNNSPSSCTSRSSIQLSSRSNSKNYSNYMTRFKSAQEPKDITRSSNSNRPSISDFDSNNSYNSSQCLSPTQIKDEFISFRSNVFDSLHQEKEKSQKQLDSDTVRSLLPFSSEKMKKNPFFKDRILTESDSLPNDKPASPRTENDNDDLTYSDPPKATRLYNKDDLESGQLNTEKLMKKKHSKNLPYLNLKKDNDSTRHRRKGKDKFIIDDHDYDFKYSEDLNERNSPKKNLTTKTQSNSIKTHKSHRNINNNDEQDYDFKYSDDDISINNQSKNIKTPQRRQKSNHQPNDFKNEYEYDLLESDSYPTSSKHDINYHNENQHKSINGEAQNSDEERSISLNKNEILNISEYDLNSSDVNNKVSKSKKQQNNSINNDYSNRNHQKAIQRNNQIDNNVSNDVNRKSLQDKSKKSGKQIINDDSSKAKTNVNNQKNSKAVISSSHPKSSKLKNDNSNDLVIDENDKNKQAKSKPNANKHKRYQNKGNSDDSNEVVNDIKDESNEQNNVESNKRKQQNSLTKDSPNEKDKFIKNNKSRTDESSNQSPKINRQNNNQATSKRQQKSSQKSNKDHNSDESNEVVNDIKDDSNEQNNTKSNKQKSSKQQNSVINDSPNEKDKLRKPNKSKTNESSQSPKTNSQNNNQATSKRHQKFSKQSNKDHNSDESNEVVNDAKDDSNEQKKSESTTQKSSKQQNRLNNDSTNEKDKLIKQNQAKTDISDESSNTNSQNNNKTTSKRNQKSSKSSNRVDNSDDSNEVRNEENDIDEQSNSTSNTQKHQKSIKQSNKDNSDESDDSIKQKNKQSTKQQKMKDSSNEETKLTQMNNQNKHQKSSKKDNQHSNDEYNNDFNETNDLIEQTNDESNKQRRQQSPKHQNKFNNDPINEKEKSKQDKSKTDDFDESVNQKGQFNNQNTNQKTSKEHQRSLKQSNQDNDSDDSNEVVNDENDSNLQRNSRNQKRQKSSKTHKHNSNDENSDESDNLIDQKNKTSNKQKLRKSNKQKLRKSNKQQINNDSSNEKTNFTKTNNTNTNQKSSKRDTQNSNDEYSNDFNQSDDQIEQSKNESNKQKSSKQLNKSDDDESTNENDKFKQRKSKSDHFDESSTQNNKLNNQNNNQETSKEHQKSSKQSKRTNNSDDSDEIINDENDNTKQYKRTSKSLTKNNSDEINESDELIDQKNKTSNKQQIQKSTKQQINHDSSNEETDFNQTNNSTTHQKSSKKSNQNSNDEYSPSKTNIKNQTKNKDKTSTKQNTDNNDDSSTEQINREVKLNKQTYKIVNKETKDVHSDNSDEEVNSKTHKKSSKSNQIKNNTDFDYSDNFKETNSKKSQKSKTNKFNDDSNEDDDSNIQNDFIDKNRQKSHNMKHKEEDQNSDDSEETNDSNTKQKRDLTKTSKRFKQTSQNNEIDSNDQHNTKTNSNNKKSNHVRNKEISDLNQYSDDLDETEHNSKGNKNKLSRKSKQLHKASQNEEEDEIDEQHNGNSKKNIRKSKNSQNERDEYDSDEIHEKTNQRNKNISQNSKRRKNHDESDLNQYSDEEYSQNEEDDTHSNRHKSPHHHNNITTPSNKKSPNNFSHHMSTKDDTFLSQESDEIDFQFTPNYKERHLNSSIEDNEVTQIKFIFPINPKFLWFPQNERTIRSTVKITATAPKIPKTIENPKQSKTRSIVKLTQEQPRRLITQNDDFYSSLKYETESEIMTNDIIMKCKYFENFDGVLKFVKTEHPEFSEEPPFKDFSVEIVRFVDLLKIDKFDYFNKEESMKLVLVNPIIRQNQFLVSPFNYCLTFDNFSIPNQKYLINPNSFINICKYRNQKTAFKLQISNKKCNKSTSFKVPRIKYQLNQNDNKRNYEIERTIIKCNDLTVNQNMMFKEKVETFLINPTNYVLNSTNFTLIPIETKDHLNQTEFRHEKDQTKEKMPQMISSSSNYLVDQKSNYNVYSQKVKDIYSPQINSINDIKCYFMEDFYLDPQQHLICQIKTNTFSIDPTNYTVKFTNHFKSESVQIKDHSNQDEFKHQKEQMKDKISKFINHCSKYLTNPKSDYNVFTHQINDIYSPKLNSIHDVKCYFIQDFYLDSPAKKVPSDKGQFNSPINNHQYLIQNTSFQPNLSNYQNKNDEFHSNTSSPIINPTSNYKLPMNHSNQIQANIFHSDNSNYSIKQNSFKPSLPNLTIQENDFHSNLSIYNKTSNDTFQSQFDQIRIEKNQMKSTTSNAFNINTTFNLFNQIDSIDSTKSDSFTINNSQYSDKNEVDCRSLQSIDNNLYKIKNARYISDKRCSFKSTTTFDYTECIQYDLNSIFPNLSLNELSESIKRKSQQNSYIQDDSSSLSDNQFVSNSFNLNSFSPISFKNIDGASNQDFDQYLIQPNDFSPKSISPKSKQNIHQHSNSIKKSLPNEVNQSINEFDLISSKSKQTINHFSSIENSKKEYLTKKVNQSNDEFSFNSYSPQNSKKRSLSNQLNQSNDEFDSISPKSKQIKKSLPNEIDEFNQTTKQDFNDYSIKQQFINNQNGFIDIKESKSKEVDNLLPVIKDEELIPAYEMSLEFREQNKDYSNRNNKMNSQTEQYEIDNSNKYKTINSVYQSEKPQFQLNFIHNFHDETFSDNFKLPIHQFNNSYHIHQNDYQSLLSYGKPTKVFLNSMSRDISLNETEIEENEEQKEEEDIDEYKLLDPSIDLLDFNTIPFKVFNLVEKDEKSDLKSVLYQSENSEEIKNIKVELTEPKSDFSSFNNYDINNYNVNKSITIDTPNQPKLNPSNFNISTDRNCIPKIQDEFKGDIVNLRNKENQMKIDNENYIPQYIGDFVNFEEKLQINQNSFIEKSSIPQKVDSYSSYQNEQIRTPINFYSNNFKEIEIGGYQCIKTENEFQDSHQFSVPTSKFTSKTEKFREKEIDFVDNNCDHFNIPANNFTDIQNSKFVTEKGDYHSSFDKYKNKEIVFNIPKTQFQLKLDSFIEKDNSCVHNQTNMHSESARYHIDYNKFNDNQPLKFICDTSDRFNQTELEVKLKSNTLSVDKLCEQSIFAKTDFDEKPVLSSYRNEVSEKISPKSSFAIVASNTQYKPIVDKPINQSSIFEDLPHSFKLPRTNLYTNFESQPKIGLKEKSDEYQHNHQDYELNSMKMQDEYLSPQTDLRQMTIANNFDKKEIFNKDGFEIEIDNNKLFTIHGDQKDFYQNETNAMKMPQMKLKLDLEKQTPKIDNNEFILPRTNKVNQIQPLTILPRNDPTNKENLFVDHKVADDSFVLKHCDFHTIETDLNDLQNDFRPIMHSNYAATKENPKVTSNDYIELNTLEMPAKTSLIDHNQSQFIDRSFELLTSHIETFKLTDKLKKINNNPIDYLNEELLNGTNSFNTQSELSLIYMERTKQIVEVVEKTCDVGTQFIFNDSDDLTIENIYINEIIEINQTEVQQPSQISNEIDDLTEIIEQPLNQDNSININENQSNDSLNQNLSEIDQSDTTNIQQIETNEIQSDQQIETNEIQSDQQIETNEIQSDQQIENNEMQSTQQIESNEIQTNETNAIESTQPIESNEMPTNENNEIESNQEIENIEIQSNEQSENMGIESNEIQIIENIQSNELVDNEMQIIVDDNLNDSNENIGTEFIENALPINESVDITKSNSNDSTNQSTASELNASIENNQIASIESMNEIDDEKANEVIEELINHSTQNTEIDEINLEIDQLFDNSTEEIEITQSIDELEDIQIEIESFEESENRRTVSTQIVELIKTIQFKPKPQKPVKVEIEIFRDVDITQSEFNINKPITKRLLYLNKCRMNEFKCKQLDIIENQCEFNSPIEPFSIKRTELFNILNSNKKVAGNSFNVSKTHCVDLINDNEFHCGIESYKTRNNTDLFQCQKSNSLDKSFKYDFQIQEIDCQNKLTKYTFNSSYLPEVAVINQINRCQLDEYKSIHSDFAPICNETVKLTKLKSKTDKYKFTPTECKSTTDSYQFYSNISIPQPTYQLNQSNFFLNSQIVKSKTTTGFTSPIRSNEFYNEINQFTENTSQYQSQSDQFTSSILCIDHIEPFTIKCGKYVNDIITKSIINNKPDDYKSNHSKFESKIEYLGHLTKIENDTEQIYQISTDQYDIPIEDNFESLQNLTSFRQTRESFKPKVEKVINEMNQFNDFLINETEQQHTFISEISPFTNKLTKFTSTQAISMSPFKQTSFNLLINVPKVQSKPTEEKVDENSPKRSRKKNKIHQTRSIKTQLSDNQQSHFDFNKQNLSEVDQKKRRIKNFLTNLSNGQITNDIMNDLTLSIISISGLDQNPTTTQMNYKVFYRSTPFPLLSNECEEFSQLLNKLCLPAKSNRSVNGILSLIKPLLIRDENDLYPLNDYKLLRSPLIRGQFKLLKVNNRPVSNHDENIFEIDLLINKEFITVNPKTRNINYTIPNCVITDDNQKLIIKAQKTRNSSSKLTEMQFTSSNQEEIKNWVTVFSKFQQKTFLLNHYLALLIQDSFDPNNIELIETAIVGSDLYLARFLFNHNRFSLKMASYIFKLFILNGKQNYLIRTLILSEFAQKDRLFESVNEFNKPLFMIFTATAFQWITSIIDKINKVKSSIQSLELILNEIEKLDPESIFILRSILILSDLVFENVSTSFIILFHFLRSIVINVASAYKSKEMADQIYSFFSQIFSVISNLTENERFVEFQTRIISEIPLLSTRLTFKNENGTVITISKVDVCQKIFSFLQKHADDFISFMANKIDVEEVHQVAFSFYYNIKLCMKNEYSIALPIHDE